MRHCLLTLSLLLISFRGYSRTVDASEFLVPVNAPVNSDAPNAQYFTLDSAKLWSALGGETRVEIANITCGNERLTLELKAVTSPINGKTQIIIGSTHGNEHIAVPHVMTFRGKVAGELNSSVVVSIVGGMIFASIRRESGETFDLAPERNGDRHILIRENDLLSISDFPRPNCFAGDIPQPNALIPIAELSRTRGLSASKPLNTNALLQTDIAIEADTCFYHALGSKQDKVIAYIISMFAMSSVIYEDEANITFHLPWIKIWTDTDPYNVKGNAYALPDPAKAYWLANYSDVQRDIAHIMTSIGYGGGGYGWYSLCDPNWSYSVSSPTTSAKFPTFAFTYDAYIVSHELGHNFGLPHSHDCYWDPPLDTCFTKNDPVHGLTLGDACDSLPITPRASPGTIMSYCPSANYALAGNNFAAFKCAMTFSPRVATVLRTNAEKAACIEAPDSAMVILQSPRGGEMLTGDSTYTIKWTFSNVQLLTLQYSNNGGQSWNGITSQLPASDGSYDWKVPNVSSQKMLVRISEAGNDSHADTSLLLFAVTQTADVHGSAGPTGLSFSIAADASGEWITLTPSHDLHHVQCAISDVLGNIVGSYSNTATSEQGMRLSTHALTSGSYFVTVSEPVHVTLPFSVVK